MGTSIRVQVALTLLLIAAPAGALSAAPDKPIDLGPGPQLFIDDYLIAQSDGVARKVVQPQRFLKEPVVTSFKGHQNWQPWYTVIHDPAQPAERRFRMWYNADTVDDPAEGAFGPVLGYVESADGMNWPLPYQRLGNADGILFGASVLDSGPKHPKPDERFKLLYHSHFPTQNRGGPVVCFSRDGMQWTQHNGGKQVLLNTGDSWHAGFDPVRKRYFMIGKVFQPYTWTNLEGQKVNRAIRIYGVSFSDDFRTWSPMKLVITPDEKDPGVTEWYAAVGFQSRGDLLIAFLQVLRDDLTAAGASKEVIDCNMGNPGGGMGHTVLAWSRDGGETWQRDRHTDPFLEPVPEVGAWDHAMAWVSTTVPVGDEIYLYYAGYRWGHKFRRSEDRQIGLVKTKRDRYVARQAGPGGGKIMTPKLKLDANALALNADVASGGEIRVQVCDDSGKPLPGFSFADCTPITGDSLSAPVTWKQPLSSVKGNPLRLEFSLRDARLFSFELN
jgi:hypothetical protein